MGIVDNLRMWITAADNVDKQPSYPPLQEGGRFIHIFCGFIHGASTRFWRFSTGYPLKLPTYVHNHVDNFFRRNTPAGVSRRWNIHGELWMSTQKIQYTARPSYSLMRWRSCSVNSVTYV